MAIAGAVYTGLLGLFWPAMPRIAPDVARGLALLWTPGAILFIEGVAVFVFVRMGVSSVTASRITLDLRHDRVSALPPTDKKQAF
jgi:hypothetical protein